jgi:hypothetical protein
VRPPRPSVVLIAAVLAVLVIAGIAAAGADAGSRSPGRDGAAASAAESFGVPRAITRPVTSALLVCPSAPAQTGVTSSTITATAPQAGSGSLTISRFGRNPGGAVAVAAPGALGVRYAVLPRVSGAFVVKATGARARGLTASVVTRTSSGPSRGLSSVPCTAPAGAAWLVGGGATPGRTSLIFLTNVDPTPALVNLTIYTAKGVEQPTPGQGVQVPPFGQITVPVDTLVPGAGAVAVEVTTISGRVSAAELDRQQNGLEIEGLDWVAPTLAPSTQTVITGIPGPPAPGLPGNPSATRVLDLVVPGAVNATVSIRLVTAGGTLSPPALTNQVESSGQLHLIDLRGFANAAPYSVQVVSDQPVVASVQTVLGPRGLTRDFAYATASGPVEGSVVLPYVYNAPGYGTAIQFVNTGQNDIDVTISFTPSVAGLRPSEHLVVPAGQLVQLAAGSGDQFVRSILVSAPRGTDDLRIGWVFGEAGAHGPLVTGGSVPQTPLTRTFPPVITDPAVGYPGQ